MLDVIVHLSAMDECGMSRDYHFTVKIPEGDTDCLQEPCAADFNHDLIIGASDMMLLIGAYQTASADYDLNMDGGVTMSDLLLFIQAFGGSCE